MDLTRGQQKAVFAPVVVMLVALGYWLIVPTVRHAERHPAAPASPSPA